MQELYRPLTVPEIHTQKTISKLKRNTSADMSKNMDFFIDCSSLFPAISITYSRKGVIVTIFKNEINMWNLIIEVLH